MLRTMWKVSKKETKVRNLHHGRYFEQEVGHPPGYAATRSTKTAAGVEPTSGAGYLFDRAGCGNTEAVSSCG